MGIYNRDLAHEDLLNNVIGVNNSFPKRQTKTNMILHDLLFDMETGVVNFIGKVIEVKGDLSLIMINNDFCPGLLRLEEQTHLDILYWFHLRDNNEHRKTLQVIPRRHDETTFRGVFASHSPSRPNPIGLTTVELLSVDECVLTVKGLDAFENSPIIDIKPRSHDY